MIQHDPSLRNAPFFNSAFNFLKLPALMSKLGFAKRSGVSAFDIFLMTFTSIMFGYKNIYQFFTSASHREDKISLDAAYRFLKNPHYNWSGLLKAITVRCISFLSNEVNPHKLPCCLVVDDTCIERTKSIKSELLAKIWNHVDQKFIRGYQCLTLGWTDGISFLPLIARMISSGSIKNRYFEAWAKVDGRTRSGRLRKMAIMPKPQQVISMCREALACGVKAEYVLFDSWFFSAHMLASLHELGLSVISLVKSNLKFALTENGIALTQRQLQQIIRQRQLKRRKDILGESLAFFHGMAVKLVFVRNRANPSNIITIVSTDLQLCAEDVVRLYINRWKIETCYFAQKQYLGLDSECQAHNFDTIHAFLQLTNIRYVIAEFSKRLEEDPRTMGELFRDTVELLHVLPFVDAINKLFEAVNTTLRQKLLEANVIVPGREQEAMDIITDTLSSWLNGTIKYIQTKVSQLRLSLNQS